MQVSVLVTVALCTALAASAGAMQAGSATLPAGARVFIAPMEDGFETYLKDAFEKKPMPLTIVDDRSRARFEISGHSETLKSTTAKNLLFGTGRSDEQASIHADLESGKVVFAYSVLPTTASGAR